MTFGAAFAPSTYTFWLVASITAHSALQRVFYASAGHHLTWNVSEKPTIDSFSGSDLTHSVIYAATPVLVRYSWTTGTGAAAIAVDNTAEETGTVSTTAPTFTGISGATNPFSGEFAAAVGVTGTYNDASSETTALEEYLLGRYPGLF